MSSVIAAKSASYVAGLDALQEDDRLRGITPRIGSDFSSSGYLAQASAPRMKKAILALEAGTPIGAGGSRLLRGNYEEHECLEADAARFFGAQTALFFGCGYFASFPVLTRLPQRHNLLVLESLVHANTHEGARLAEPLSESAPIRTRRLSRAKFATGVPRAERGRSGS